MDDNDDEETTSDSLNGIISATEIQQCGFRFEYTELYRLIERCTRASLSHAWRLAATMSDEEVLQRSEQHLTTYLHHIVNQVYTDRTS